MGIPGRKLDRLETRAKVRIGEKRLSKKGREYPAAVDYFVCDDNEFLELCGEKPKTIRVTLPFATADENFSTGLERWLSKKNGPGQVLTCYTHDDGPSPVALRLTDFLQPGDEIRGEPRGQNRTPITCRADDCVFFKDKTCKPMGRLQFFLEGGRTDQALQFDTKSWNTIEQVAGALKGAARMGDLRGRVFELSVAFVNKGTDRFPVVSIQEVDVPLDVNKPADVDLGELLIAGSQALDSGEELAMKVALAKLLDGVRPGWRDDEAYIERIKEVGAEKALRGTLAAAAEKLA